MDVVKTITQWVCAFVFTTPLGVMQEDLLQS